MTKWSNSCSVLLCLHIVIINMNVCNNRLFNSIIKSFLKPLITRIGVNVLQNFKICFSALLFVSLFVGTFFLINKSKKQDAEMSTSKDWKTLSHVFPYFRCCHFDVPLFKNIWKKNYSLNTEKWYQLVNKEEEKDIPVMVDSKLKSDKWWKSKRKYCWYNIKKY